MMFSFLETGTVHAIGAGLVVAEIQQTSILRIVSMILTGRC
jgi:mannose-6-phosphate isomerase class I